ncbi:uncharacterized protein LOC143290003 isoform X2 [Babylonia areolata]|uniref:uncharacterized protein LOC143290003 isoform X2 n=1 Tax=Babylonia areolata TaxID=304850 RepID=UPI003FD0E1F2
MADRVFTSVYRCLCFWLRLSKLVRAALWRWRKVELVIAVIIALLLIAAELRPPCLWSYLMLKRYPKLRQEEPTDVTLVTAYFNLGRVEKLGSSLSTYKYLLWAEAFQYVLNPLVVYTDSEQIENMFLETRKQLSNRTRVVRVSRSSLDSFRDVEKIRQLFQDPEYPKFHPNTVVPEYPCSQHAKYELVRRTLDDTNFFPENRYVAWVDIGYFRYLIKRRRPFYLTTPPGWDESAVAMTRIAWPDWSLHPSDIVRGNLVWVAGGMSVATRPVYARFVQEYQVCTAALLKQGLSSTDQQVIYSMFTQAHNATHRIRTRIQTYSWFLNDLRNCWFYLGFLCYREVD